MTWIKRAHPDRRLPNDHICDLLTMRHDLIIFLGVIMRIFRLALGSARVIESAYARECPQVLPRRSIIALGVGFIFVTTGVAQFGPSLRSVFAEEQDQRAIYMNMLTQERGQGRAAANASGPHTSATASMRSLFGIGVNGGDRSIPDGVRAYAPVQSLFPRSAVRRAARARSANEPMMSSAFSSSGGGLSRRSVCVRLCDGFAFPVADYSGPGDDDAHSAICAGMCPGAPTRLYVAPSGSDKIEDMVSPRDHKPYSELPVALRYTSVSDPTCSCHPPGASVVDSVSVLKDFTLRAGDKVMTERGFRVFRGASKWPFRRGDFTPLAEAGLGRGEMSMLRAMEKVSRIASSKEAPKALPAPQNPNAATTIPAASRAPRVVGPRMFLSQNDGASINLP